MKEMLTGYATELPGSLLKDLAPSPKIKWANPISCERGLTGETGYFDISARATVVNGVVTEITFCENSEMHIDSVGPRWGGSCRPAMEEARELCKWGDYANWPNHPFKACMEKRVKDKGVNAIESPFWREHFAYAVA